MPDLDLRRVDAVDSRALGHTDLAKWISPKAKDQKYIREPSRLAVWLSHRRVWELIAASHDETLALVLEDDAVFVCDFFTRLEEVIVRPHHRFDVSNLASSESLAFDVALIGPYNVQRSADGALLSFEGTQAYLLSRAGAARLLALTTPGALTAALDWALAEWSASNQLRLHIVPHLARQQRLLSGSDVSPYRSHSASASPLYFAPDLGHVAAVAHMRATSLIQPVAAAMPSLSPRVDDVCLCLADLLPCLAAVAALPADASPAQRLLVQRRAREFVELSQDQAQLFLMHALVAPLTGEALATAKSVAESLTAVLAPPPPPLSPGALALSAIDGAQGERRTPLVWDRDTVASILGEFSAADSPWCFPQASAPSEEPRYLLLCFSSAGGWHAYHDAFNALRSAQPNARLWLTEELPEAMRTNTGVLALVEWRSARVLAARQLAMPQGVWVDARTLLVGRRLCHDVLSLAVASRTATPQRISHPQLANIHTIERCPFVTDSDVYLLSSADSDALFEVTASGEVLWHWSGAEHGFIAPNTYANRPMTYSNGERSPPADMRAYTFHSLAHALHPNSAAYLTRDRILVTLFHVHRLGIIDRATGELTQLPMLLSFPHAVRPARAQAAGSHVAYSVCNTRGGQIVLLDRDAQEIKRLSVACLWIQVRIAAHLWCSVEY